MCLATSKKLLLVLQDAKNRIIFSTHSRSSGQPKNDAKTLFSILHHLSAVILANAIVRVCIASYKTQLLKGLYCLKQRLLRNRLRSGSCDLSRLLARKITKGVHSCKPASPSNPIIISSTLLPSSVITGYATEGARLQIISARHSYAVRAIRKV